MAGPRNRHCASCIGTLSFPIERDDSKQAFPRRQLSTTFRPVRRERRVTWLCNCNRSLDSRVKSFASWPFLRFQPTTFGKLFARTCLFDEQCNSVPVKVMPCGWEGNRRSNPSLALAMRRRLDVRTHGLRKGDEHPVLHSSWGE